MSKTWWKMYIGLQAKYPLFLSDFNETQIFYTDFRVIRKLQNSWKSVHWEPSCSMRKDRRTNRHDKSYQSLSAILRKRLKTRGRKAIRLYRIWNHNFSRRPALCLTEPNSSYHNCVASVILLGSSHLQQVAYSNRFLRLEGVKKRFHKKPNLFQLKVAAEWPMSNAIWGHRKKERFGWRPVGWKEASRGRVRFKP